MSTIINIGMTQEEATQAGASTSTSYEPLPEGDYELQIDSVEQKLSARKGRPMLNFKFVVINDPSYNGRFVFRSAPLPWTNPATNAFESSGIGILTSICEGCGVQWNAQELDTDDLHGLNCTAKIVIKDRMKDGQPVKDDAGQPVRDNEIKKFL